VIRVWTVGHSNQPLANFIGTLSDASIELLVDVRRFPSSRRNPWFNRDALAAALEESGIDYRHMGSLGGRRQPRPDSANTALTNDGFRGFADFMATAEFEAALAELIDLADAKHTAVMCAEALPWRCHRSLISDALVARDIEVVHLLGAGSRLHELSPIARVETTHVSYPALL